MPIFISYSHEDKDFVLSLAQNLVFARHNVWIDTWELNAGDSLIDRIQSAIVESDAILVILSKASLESAWCKRELNSGLVREMEEKRVVLIPCIVGDCDIPLFLRDKLYVDFRKDKDGAFNLLDRSLRRISNPTQSRIDRQDFHTDWSVDWGDFGKNYVVEWLFVEHSEKSPYSIVTRCRLIFEGEKANAKFKEHLKDGDQIEYASLFLSDFVEGKKGGNFRVQIEDSREVSETVNMIGRDGEKAIFHIGIRRLGIDNGMDTLFTVDEILRRAVKHSTGALRANPEHSSSN